LTPFPLFQHKISVGILLKNDPFFTIFVNVVGYGLCLQGIYQDFMPELLRRVLSPRLIL